VAEQNLYDILGVGRDASDKEIDKAYRRLARRYHPDVNPGDKQAEEHFKKIAAAHEVLSSPEKRKLYDEFGEEARKIGFDPEKARAYREWQQRARAGASFGGSNADIFGGFGEHGAGGFDLGEIFGDMLGRDARPPTGPRRGSDVRAAISLPFRDAVLGAEREIAFPRAETCGACHATGTKDGKKPAQCSQCGGKGTVNVARGPIQFRGPCSHCRGSGHEPAPACATCGGEGLLMRTAKLRVRIPPGVENGQTIRLAGQGMPGRMGGAAGDLLVEVDVLTHGLLRRQGQDLYLDVPVTVVEAMLGATITVPSLQGDVSIKVPPGSQNGRRLRVRGKGVPAHKRRTAGDLLLTLSVVLPKADPAAIEATVRNLEQLYHGDVRASLKL
jgi:molecular chaperone DnaJ